MWNVPYSAKFSRHLNFVEWQSISLNYTHTLYVVSSVSYKHAFVDIIIEPIMSPSFVAMLLFYIYYE